MTKTIYFSLLSFFIFNITTTFYSQTSISPGNVSGNWTLAGSPYLIEGHIIIQPNENLTIEPGVIVEFQGHYKLNVQGNLLAIGTENSIINFTSANLDEGWWGVRYDQTPASQDSSFFSFCNFSYGKTNTSLDIDGAGGAILLHYFSKVRVSNCSFVNNDAQRGGGIACIYSNEAKFFSNSFINNTGSNGGAIHCEFSSPIISNSLFESNEANYYGGALYFEHSNLNILGNNFYENNAGWTGGAIHISDSPNFQIISNEFSTNSAGGGGAIFMTTDSSGEISLNNFWVTNLGRYLY